MYHFSLIEKTGKQYQVPRIPKRRSQLQVLPEVAPESYNRSYQKVFTKKMEGGEAPKKVKRANGVRYLEKRKTAKIKRSRRRKMRENTGPRLPVPHPPPRRAPYGASEANAENRLGVTKESKDRQDKIAGAAASPTVDGKVPETGAFGGESFQQQGSMGRSASGNKDSIMQVVVFGRASRTRKALAREALFIRIRKNCKGERLHWAEEKEDDGSKILEQEEPTTYKRVHYMV